MRNFWSTTFERFARAVDGVVSLMLALALIPLLAVAGAAVDYSQAVRDRTELQSAADAAVLAAVREFGRESGDPSRVADEHARRVAQASGIAVGSVVYRREDDTHIVIVSATRDNAFGGFTLNESELVVRAEAMAGRTGRPAQIAIVMDTTASMNFGANWSSATTTITSFLEQMQSRDRDRFRVAFVPFSDRVRIAGLPGYDAWVDRHRPGNWNGCVEPIERASDEFAFSVDASLPGGGNPRLFVSHQSTIAQGRGAIGREAHHGTPYCPNVTVVPPTNDLRSIERAVGAARPGGTGRFDEGLVWGWRMLSPDWMDAMGATPPRGDEEPERIAVFFTDGNATIYEIEVGGRAGGHYGWNNGSPLGFAHLVDLCERMRADGVRIVMMRLPGNTHFESYARACAGSAEDYFYVDGPAALEQALGQVAGTATNVRLTR